MLNQGQLQPLSTDYVFSEKVETIAEFMSVGTKESVTDIVVPLLGATALVLDADGTLYKLDEEPKEEVVNWVMEANEYFKGQLMIVTNNVAVHEFHGIKTCTRKSWYDYKLTSLRNRIAVSSLKCSRVSKSTIFAATDSPSDILSNKLAGIPFSNQFLVRSLGAHPVQELAREHLYPTVANVGSRLVAMADLFRS